MTARRTHTAPLNSLPPRTTGGPGSQTPCLACAWEVVRGWWHGRHTETRAHRRCSLLRSRTAQSKYGSRGGFRCARVSRGVPNPALNDLTKYPVLNCLNYPTPPFKCSILHYTGGVGDPAKPQQMKPQFYTYMKADAVHPVGEAREPCALVWLAEDIVAVCYDVGDIVAWRIAPAV